jgi:hypothetical protein
VREWEGVKGCEMEDGRWKMENEMENVKRQRAGLEKR